MATSYRQQRQAALGMSLEKYAALRAKHIDNLTKWVQRTHKLSEADARKFVKDNKLAPRRNESQASKERKARIMGDRGPTMLPIDIDGDDYVAIYENGS